MAIPILGDLIEELGATARHFIPGAEAKRDFQLKLEEIKDRAAARDFELSKGQIEINKVEAEHKSIFVAGWRPALGWVGAAGAGVGFIIVPLSQMLTAWWKGLIVPDYPMENLIVLMGWMLGQSAIRSVDLKMGTVGKSWNPKPGQVGEGQQLVQTIAPAEADIQTTITPATTDADDEKDSPWNRK